MITEYSMMIYFNISLVCFFHSLLLFIFNALAEKKWVKVETKNPPQRAISLHTAVIVGNKMYVFGGSEHTTNSAHSQGLTSSNQLYELSLDTLTWRRIQRQQGLSDIIPSARLAHSAVEYEGRMYVFGGESHSANRDTRLNDLWEFDPVRMSWRLLPVTGTIPHPRFLPHTNCPPFYYSL